MRFLYRFAIHRPFVTLLIAAAAVATAAPGLLALHLRTDGGALVPADRPEVIADRDIRRQFDVEDLIVILIRSNRPDGIFDPAVLELVQRLTREVRGVEGVHPDNTSSLDTEFSHRVRQGTLRFRTFLEPLPDSPEAAETLRADLETIRLHTGTIVSDDGSAASILVGVLPGADRVALYARLQELVQAHRLPQTEIDVIGAPVAESLLGTHILEDLGVPRSLLGLRATLDEPVDSSIQVGSWQRLKQLATRHVGMVPVAIGLMALVFAACYRSLTAAMLPMIEVGACLLFVFGLMGWFDVPVYLTIAVMPVILTAVGVADEIHVFNSYTNRLRSHPEERPQEAVDAALERMHRPVIKTSVTTAVGFLSFAISPLPPVQAFGVFTAAGVIFCMFWSLTVIPASLVLLHGWFARKVRQSQPSAIQIPPTRRAMDRIARFTTAYRWPIIAVACIAVIAAPFGIQRLRVQDSWIDGFAEGSEFREATEFFNQHFLGAHFLLVHLHAPHQNLTARIGAAAVDHLRIVLPAHVTDEPDALVGRRLVLRPANAEEAANQPSPHVRSPLNWVTRIVEARQLGDTIALNLERRRGSPVIAFRPEPGDEFLCYILDEPLTDPDVVRAIAGLEEFIDSRRDLTVGGVIGLDALLATTHFMASGLSAQARVIPDNTEKILWLWEQYEGIRGTYRRSQLANAELSECVVTVFLKNANYRDVGQLMAAIRDYHREHLAPKNINLRFGGDVAVSQTLIASIVDTQVRSLIVSLVGIFILASLLNRNLIYGVLSVLPCAFAVYLDFAMMGWLGLPLGVATSMFAGMTLGIGVDYAVHLLEQYRRARGLGWTPADATTEALRHAGPPVIIDAAGVALGFGVLTLSQVPANARLGTLLVLSIAGCLVATLLLLPALLTRRPR